MKDCIASNEFSLALLNIEPTIIEQVTIPVDQLGIEREYEQKLMPDGRIAVDGFVCVYDVSAVPNRSPERQTEFLAQVTLAYFPKGTSK